MGHDRVLTESDWLTGMDVTPMLQFLRGRALDRKIRLFAVACYKRVWRLIKDSRSYEAVIAVERIADGQEAPEGVAGITANVTSAALACEDDAFFGTRQAFATAKAVEAAAQTLGNPGECQAHTLTALVVGSEADGKDTCESGCLRNGRR